MRYPIGGLQRQRGGGLFDRYPPAREFVLHLRPLIEQVVVAEIAHCLHQPDRVRLALAAGDEARGFQRTQQRAHILGRALQPPRQVTQRRWTAGLAEVRADRAQALGLAAG